jgi:hypothetical protein
VIALADQDDVWRRDKLERLAGLLDAFPTLTAVHSDARMVDAAGSSSGETLFGTLGLRARERRDLERGRALRVLLRRNVATGATMMVRRELVATALPVPDGWIHDEWLAMVSAVAGGLRCLPEPLIDYRQHESNQIGARRLTFIQKIGRITEPRRERNDRLLKRAASLVERLDVDATEPRVRRRLRRKLAHERLRSRLPRNRIARVPGILVETLRGRYHSYGRGVPDIVRDLIQPDD